MSFCIGVEEVTTGWEKDITMGDFFSQKAGPVTTITENRNAGHPRTNYLDLSQMLQWCLLIFQKGEN